MFDILLPNQDERPLYQQLYLQIRDQIRSGRLADGARLPSVRALQSQLNISKTPIETAYQMLTAEGYVMSKPRSGLIVANPHKPQAAGAANPDAAAAAVSRVAAAGARSPEHTRSDAPLIDFNPTALDPEAFPVRTWSNMLKEALDRHLGEIGKYGDPQGELELRTALAEYLRNSRGVNCLPEQIIIGSGMAYSVGILTKLLTEARRMAFEEPGYSLVRDHLLLNGCRIVPVPVGDRGISLSALEASDARMVYVTPSHQFPTGSIMPYPERERLLEWADARSAYIIEDDYDGEFRYLGKPIPSLQGLDNHGRVIYIGTFSKALAPVLRMNYMVLPLELAERLSAMPHEVVSAPSRVEQWAMHAFLEQGHWYRHIRRTRHLYRRKHLHLISLIQAYLDPHVEITGQNAGLHVQLSVHASQTSEELVRSAAEAGVRVYDFRKAWMKQRQNPGDAPRLYLGFAGISLEDMETGIRLLKRAWFKE